MTSFYEESGLSSEDIFRDIQTEHMICQINSSAEAKKIANKMKEGADEIIKTMQAARKIAHDKKIETDELKINLSEKREKMKKLQQELEHIKKREVPIAKKTSDLVIEINKIKDAIEKIKEATQDLDPKYFEQSQKELSDSLIRITLETEKAQSELNAIRKMEEMTSKKLLVVENDFIKIESDTFSKVRATERIISNVSATIKHIIKSYDEITNVSKDLLKSATSPDTEFSGNNNYEFEQNQPEQKFKDTRVAI
ncbi:MAG: hypothetical protein HKP31_08690 [Nitrosopumilus sp.]|nr:hypothetical protein [Nitrosopumilus sp.]